MSTLKKKNKGIALAEMIIASAVMLVVVVSTTTLYNSYVQYALGSQNDVQAGYLLEENLEAVSFLRDSSWTTNIASLTAGTTYYLYWNGTNWTSTTTVQYVDSIFLRSFMLSDVNRDSNNDIASSGTNDTDTKKITSTVSYFQGHATTTRTLSMYITNINNN